VTKPILPGATIGMLGGGQLGRMTAMAARSMGYDIHVLDPDPDCPARPLASRCITAAFDDAEAAASLASQCDVVTLEIEQIGVASLEAAAAHAPLRPGVEMVRVIQDRIRQKVWLANHGFPLGAHRIVTSEDECAAAVDALGPSVVKAPTGGYDGRGQIRVTVVDEARAAWHSLGKRPCVVEQFLDIDLELSVMVARRSDGTIVTFPLSQNHHEKGVLDWSVIPGPLHAEVVRHATQIGRAIAETFRTEGLIAAELFLLRDGRLLVNELAPRPHNTFHSTERACVTSQFEQLVRTVCDLPLGATDIIQPGAIANLLGDLWVDENEPPFTAALEVPGVRLHLYGKRSARPGRKMGHLSAVAREGNEALRLVLEARGRLAHAGTSITLNAG
jgi:5-(carboxyamino)imidazole ribonucleotide synthase